MPAGAAVTGAKVKPAPYAKSLCSKIGKWQSTIVDASDDATAAGPTTAKAAKKVLLKLINRSLKATKKVVKDLKKVGDPDVTGGKQISNIFRQGFSQVVSRLTQTRQALKDADTGDTATFQAAARTAEDALEAGLESVQQGLRAAGTIDVPELNEAFNAESACTDITS